MASPGVPVVRAELVKCCRDTSWEQADMEAGTCPALRGPGWGEGGVSPTFTITKPAMRAGGWGWDSSGGGHAVLIQGCCRFWLSRLW